MATDVLFVAVSRSDGGLSILQIVDLNADDETIDALVIKHGIEAVSWRRISPDDLPQDRTDRDAWVDDGESIAVDQARAALLLAQGSV